MVLVGGRGTRLGPITKNIAKPAVSFAGKYRLIDFSLSNLSNSNIDIVGIITQYEPHELMSYIGHGATWDLDVQDGGISFLTPFTSSSGDFWQKGTAHAIYQHCRFIEQYNPEYVLILSGDHIYKMDYNDMIKKHEESDADITLGAFEAGKDASRFGILTIDEQNVVTDFEEKPQYPKSSLASMGIYLFKRELLKELLEDSPKQMVDFGKDIIPFALSLGKKIQAFLNKGYFRDVGTIESLYEANMEQIDTPAKLRLREYSNLPIYTRSNNLPPHHIGQHSKVTNSLISDGCLIMGNVNHSVLSSNVLIMNNSSVEDSVIHRYVTIGENSSLKNVMVVEGTTIPDNTTLEFKKVTVIDQTHFEGAEKIE